LGRGRNGVKNVRENKVPKRGNIKLLKGGRVKNQSRKRSWKKKIRSSFWGDRRGEQRRIKPTSLGKHDYEQGGGGGD